MTMTHTPNWWDLWPAHGITAPATLAAVFVLAGTAPDLKTSKMLMTLGEGLAEDMPDDDVRGAYEDAKALLVGAPVPGAGAAAPAPTGGPLTVYTLEISIYHDDDSADFAPWSFVHLTEAGAVEKLHTKLAEWGIDPQIAHQGETRFDGFVGNDFHDGTFDTVSWGIKRTIVGR